MSDYENWTREQWLATDLREMCERLHVAAREFGLDAPAGTLGDVVIIEALRDALKRLHEIEHIAKGEKS